MKHTLQVHMTNQCNLKCEYCYIKQNNQKMTMDMLQQQLDCVEELSTRLNGQQQYEYDVTYFGGEPLLEFDNILLLDEYIQSKLNISHKFMQTNGILLDDKIIKQLFYRNINVGVSCDGCKDKNYSAIEELYSNYIVPMQPKMMVDGYNVCDMMTNIKYFFDLALRTNQRNFYIDASFVKDDVWSEEALKELKKQLYLLKDFILEIYQRYNYYLKIGFLDRVFQNILLKKRDYICFAGSSGFSLTPTGIIYPCSRFFSANKYPLYDSNDNKWYEDNIDFVKRVNTTHLQECEQCAIGKYCNQGCLFSQIQNGGIIKGYCQVQKMAFHVATELYQDMKDKYNINIMTMKGR